MGMLEGQIDLRKKKNFDHLTRKQLEKRYTDLLERHRELIMYKDDNEFFEKDLEHIVNLAMNWMRENIKDENHRLEITKKTADLFKAKSERSWS